MPLGNTVVTQHNVAFGAAAKYILSRYKAALRAGVHAAQYANNAYGCGSHRLGNSSGGGLFADGDLLVASDGIESADLTPFASGDFLDGADPALADAAASGTPEDVATRGVNM
jgi:hypothetical protein